MFFQRPALSTAAAEQLASEVYSKRMQKLHGPWRVLCVGPEYLEILQKHIDSAVSINRANLVTQKGAVLDQPLSQTAEPEEKSRQPANELQDNNMEQCAVEWIIHHVTTKEGPYYVVRWYRYSGKKYNVNPLEHLLNHFVDTYWRQKKRQSANTERMRNNLTRFECNWPTKANNRPHSLRLARRYTYTPVQRSEKVA